MRTLRAIALAILLAILSSAPMQAQELYGQRLRSMDGQWVLPVASLILASSDDDHVSRGSINSWDLSAAIGSPVFAAAPGIVKTAGCYLYEHKVTPNLQGYGCSLQVDHGGGIVSQYGHCKEGTLYVKAGDRVTADSLLCQVGLTGVTGWPHTHFTILKNGSPIRIDSVFDIGRMHYCKFCKADNNPSAPVVGAVGATQGQQPTGYDSLGMRLLRTLGEGIAQTEPAALQMGLTALLMGIMLALWFSPNWARVAIVAGLISTGCATGVALMFVPMPTVQAAGSWQQAYAFTAKSEGWDKTADGAHTMGGVTQGTYNAWRKAKGLPPADVQHALTETERQAIFYERYWLASGADMLPFKLAMTYVDHVFVTGSAKAGLARCGTDVRCFNDWRITDFQGKGNCHLYCAGWINRVNRIRSLTEY